MAESSGDICPPFLSAMKSIIDKIHTQQIKPILYQLFPFSRHLYILKQQLYPIYVLSGKFNQRTYHFVFKPHLIHHIILLIFYYWVETLKLK